MNGTLRAVHRSFMCGLFAPERIGFQEALGVAPLAWRHVEALELPHLPTPRIAPLQAQQDAILLG